MPFNAGRQSPINRPLSPLAKKGSQPAFRRFGGGSPRTRTRTTFFLLCSALIFIYYWRESLFEVPEGPSNFPRPQHASPSRSEFFTVDGLLYSRSQDNGGHPILHLIAQGKREWAAKVARQSKNLQQAVREYERRYRRRPPKGFDKWFVYAKEAQVVLVDEYDQINRDLEPLLGLPTELLKQRSQHLVEDEDNYYRKGSYTIQVKNHRVAVISGNLERSDRATAQADMLKHFIQWIPDINITTWMHDTPVLHTAGENKARYTELAKQGQTLPRAEWNDARWVPDFVGWELFCLPGANLRQYMAGINAGQKPVGRSFVSNHYEAMEICRHPENLNLHSLTSNYGIGPAAVLHWPLFSYSKMAMFSDILIAPLEQYEAPTGDDPAWEAKSHNKLLWRGSTTGSFYNHATLWRSTQRSRLNFLTNHAQGTRSVLTADASGKQHVQESVDTARLNAQLFDVAFTGNPLQCQEDDGTCAAVRRAYRFDDFMSSEEANDYKYVFDVDGNGWSGRYHRLLSTKTVVLKSTGYPEWYQDMIQPWVHYVPVKIDYSDLHDIMTFFVGLDGADAHDELGREIGEAGKEWADRFWREEDMEVYMFRLYLEYARVMGPRDGSMDYEG